jgi:integrase
VSDIPDLDTILALQAAEGFCSLIVRNGKGGKVRRVPVNPHLLRMTHEFIHIEREAIVKRYEGRKTVPDNVFISDRGKELHPNSVSNLMRCIFDDAKVLNASLHRLRAVFLTRVVERFMHQVDERGLPSGDTTVLLRAAQWAGHSNIMSLKPYLNKLKLARRNPSLDNLANLEQSAKLVRRELAVLKAQVEKFGRSAVH